MPMRSMHLERHRFNGIALLANMLDDLFITILDCSTHLSPFLLRARRALSIQIACSSTYTGESVTVSNLCCRFLPPFTCPCSSRCSVELPSAAVSFFDFPAKAPDMAPKTFKLTPAYSALVNTCSRAFERLETGNSTTPVTWLQA